MESLWRVETHAHTAPVSPCGRLAPEQLVEQVRAAGYDALFVTDHYTPEFFAVHPTGEDYRIYLERYFSGYRRAAEAGRKAGLRVFPGLEVRLYDGPEDYLVRPNVYAFEVALTERIAREQQEEDVRHRRDDDLSELLFEQALAADCELH